PSRTMSSGAGSEVLMPLAFGEADMTFAPAKCPLMTQSACSDGDSLYKHHPRTDADAAVQIHDVPVVHADAARRHQAANRARIVGAVDGEFVVDQHECRGAHRIFRRATLNIEVWRPFSTQRHRWLPRRFDVFAGDPRGAVPLLAGAANADRVLERLVLAGDEIKASFRTLYHDAAGLGLTGVWDLFGRGARR